MATPSSSRLHQETQYLPSIKVIHKFSKPYINDTQSLIDYSPALQHFMNMLTGASLIKDTIRDIPDFPKPGIIFKDICPVLSDHHAFQTSIDLLLTNLKNQGIEKIIGLDARGFLFATPIALALKVGFIPVRKKGKLPHDTLSTDYALEYGTNTVEIHKDAIQPGEKVAIVDDLLATGGTAAAAIKLIHQLGGDLISISFLIELSFLNGREKLDCPQIHSIITY